MKTSTKTKVLELRFPEFENRWETNNLGNSSNMKSGDFVPAKKIRDKKLDYNYPCYGGNGLRGFTDTFTHEGKYSLIGRQGALCGNVKLVEGKFHATEHAVVVKHDKNFDTDFLFYILKNLDLNRYATGQAQPGLSITNIRSVKFSFPSLPEQQKIAAFLSQVDRKINLLQQKVSALETYKKGVMQQLFSQQLRFKQGDGSDFPDWEEKKLGEYLISKSVRNKNLRISRVLSVSNTKGFITQSEQFDNHRVASKNVSNYKIVEKFDIAYNPSRINVGSIAVLKDYEDGIVSPMYVIFRLKKTLHLKYFENLIETHLFKHYVKVGCSGSVRDSLNYEELEKFKFKFPSKDEQTKIANFLSAIDQKITHTQEQLEQTQSFKKGLLQKLFV
jgi:type I restriction enzyme S subunit